MRECTDVSGPSHCGLCHITTRTAEPLQLEGLGPMTWELPSRPPPPGHICNPQTYSASCLLLLGLLQPATKTAPFPAMAADAVRELLSVTSAALDKSDALFADTKRFVKHAEAGGFRAPAVLALPAEKLAPPCAASLAATFGPDPPSDSRCQRHCGAGRRLRQSRCL